MPAHAVDLLVIGGGINGAGIARDAAGRGLAVLLCEQDDLAAHTSSASTKLIHGGLRYLAGGHLGLVRESLRERAVLLRNAPHIVWPLRFVMPHHAGGRPWWMLRLGLGLYDSLGGRGALAPSARIGDLARHAAGRALQGRYRRAFAYSDCWVQDSRLVVLNARDARARGAEIRTRTACVSLSACGAGWRAVLADRATGARTAVAARAVVNAGGPWAGRVRALAGAAGAGRRMRLVKGSHIVVRRLFEHAHPYLFQIGDGRVLFALPYEEDYTLLGTTEVPFAGAPGRVEIAPQEVDYICAAANAYLAAPVAPGDVVWSYAGLRPLVDDRAESASRVARGYALQLERAPAPLLSVYGGKITTYRRLAEKAVDMLARPLGAGGGRWTRDAPLPGGAVGSGGIEGFAARSAARYPWLPARLLRHYVRHYGADIDTLLAGCGSVDDLGEHFGAGLYAAEAGYLALHEWARSAEDILWRRTRKGLGVAAPGAARLQAYLEAPPGAR